MAAAGIEKDKDLILDGVNLLPYLSGKKKGNPHDKLFWRKLDEAGARNGKYKLIRLKNYGSVLYNLTNDLGETNNLITKESTTAKELLESLSDWESKMIAPLWREGKAWEDVTYHIHQKLMENKEVLYKDPKGKNNILNHKN